MIFPKQKYKQDIKIHLKIDTGMHRNGICVENLEHAIDLIQSSDLKLTECLHILLVQMKWMEVFCSKRKFFKKLKR